RRNNTSAPSGSSAQANWLEWAVTISCAAAISSSGRPGAAATRQGAGVAVGGEVGGSSALGAAVAVAAGTTVLATVAPAEETVAAGGTAVGGGVCPQPVKKRTKRTRGTSKWKRLVID